MQSDLELAREIAPCPFCGGDASYTLHEGHEHSSALMALMPAGFSRVAPDQHEVSCHACGIGAIGEDRAEVVARWSRRTPDAAALTAAREAERKAAAQVARREMLTGAGCCDPRTWDHGFNAGCQAAAVAIERGDHSGGDDAEV